jgi:thiol-disulfide isomerase/thioredoxin
MMCRIILPPARIVAGRQRYETPAHCSGRGVLSLPAFLTSLPAILLSLPGCAGQPPTPPPAEVVLNSIDAPGLAQVIEKHRGQVVLVDFWATWCGPCLELFPHTMELHRRFHDRGLAVVTVSLDDPDNRPAVLKSLIRNQATTENYLATYGVGPAAFTAFAIDDGALPHVRLYGRDGKLHRTFASGGKQLDAEEVERSVGEVLGL